MDAKERIIVALDVSDLERAKILVETLSPHIGYFKIGLELQTAVGTPEAIKFIHNLGGKIFFDGKFDDIPNTVGKAVRNISSLGVSFLNIHASAGKKAIRAAVENRGDTAVLGVTVLTSIDEKECLSIFGDKPGKKVLQFAGMLAEQKAQGIICSPKELEFLGKKKDLTKLIKVIPGIRPIWAASNDQKRIMTPADAVRAGADYLVIGRPITNPPKKIRDPLGAVVQIKKEIESVLKE